MLESESDIQLLDAWRRSRDRGAMDQLIRRHVHFVYGAARRMLNGDASAAEDVTQAVFMLLIQKSPRLPSDASIAVWLHRTARYACANARKMESRRIARDRRIALANNSFESTSMQNEINAIDHADERERMLPLLDEAITQLGERDRSGVILCYFQRRTFREIGAVLGTTEDAARKRVGRSIERIREYFLSRGVAMSASKGVGPIVACLTSESTAAAPASLVIATTKLATVTHIAASAYPSAQIAQKVMHTMLMWKVKLATAACAAIVATSAVTATAIHQFSSGIAPVVVASSSALLSNNRAPESFEAKVSDATTVQLLGVAKFGSDDWFSIDGQKIDDPRGPWAEHPIRTREGMTHQAMILVTYHGEHGASTRIQIPKASQFDRFVLTPDEQRSFWLVPFSVAEGTSSIELEVLIADGEWKAVHTAEHQRPGTPLGSQKTEVGGIAFTHVSENPRNPNGCVVYVAHEVKDQQFDVIAVDAQGNERGCDDVYSEDLGSFRATRYEYGIPADQIKAFVAKVRAFNKRVVVKNVTLDPNKPTKPTIEVSDIPAPPAKK